MAGKTTGKRALPGPRSTGGVRIVATIGPASLDIGTIRRLARAGADAFRLNFSHGDWKTHGTAIGRIRQVERELGRPLVIVADLPGPKIRTRPAGNDESFRLRRGEEVRLSLRARQSDPGRVALEAPEHSGRLPRGTPVLVDDGRIELRVEGRHGSDFRARVVRGGIVRSRAGVNFPGRESGLSAPTGRDLRTAAFAARRGADAVALSFVQGPDDVEKLERFLHRHRLNVSIISKLEKPAALENLNGILETSDGVMVARGDLGVELSLERVPLWQKRILQRARSFAIPTITATQMLESMVESASPTRAEVSDVANAILDGTDAVMLSAETAIGKHPVEAVRVLARIAREVERGAPTTVPPLLPDLEERWEGDPVDAIARAALQLVGRVDARALVVFTRTGRTARILARHRPGTPILALTSSERVRRRLGLLWNTRTLRLPEFRNADRLFREARSRLRDSRLVRRGDTLVLVGGATNLEPVTNLLRLVKV